LKKYALLGFVILLMLPFVTIQTDISNISGSQGGGGDPTSVGGIISQNTTWSLADSPYIVVEDVIVYANVCLEIESGVVVRFANGTSLIIDGILVAYGNTTHTTIFTSNATAPATSDWGALNVRIGGFYLDVSYVKVEYSTNGIKGLLNSTLSHSSFYKNNVGLSGSNITMAFCSFEENALGANVTNAFISESQFYNNTKGLQFSGTVVDSNVTRNKSTGLSGNGDVENVSVTYNGGDGITGGSIVRNCLILNNSGSGVGSAQEIHESLICNNTGNGASANQIYNSTICNNNGGASARQIYDSTICNNTGSGAGASEIYNCTICSNSGYGVSLGFDYHQTFDKIYNSNICNNSGLGVIVSDNYLHITKTLAYCDISGNLAGGILAKGAYWLYIEHSEISRNLFGIELNPYTGSGETWLKVSNSDIIDNSENGIFCTPSGYLYYGFNPVRATVLDSIIDGNGAYGIGMLTTGYNRYPYGSSVQICFPITEISNSVISDHLIGAWGEFDSVTGSTIESNSLIGLNVAASTPYSSSSGPITYNNISSNGVGLDINNSVGPINWNNIHDNAVYNVLDRIPFDTDINATYNWWGTINETQIQEDIFDYYDNYTLGKVLYQPYLIAPVEIDQVSPNIGNISRTPDSPDYDDGVIVSSTITDNVAVDCALLSYTNAMKWYNASMNRFGDVFEATIHAQPYGTIVQYRICANDTNGNWAESTTCSYLVGDFTAPEIVDLDLQPTCPCPYVPSNVTRANEPTLVIAHLDEPVNASGVSRVYFSFRVDQGEWWNTTMKYNATSNSWCATIPGQPGNTIVHFYISAYDNAGNARTSPTYSFGVRTLPIGDINGDGIVELMDFFIMSQHYLEHL
jgi:hypothetical protein